MPDAMTGNLLGVVDKRRDLTSGDEHLRFVHHEAEFTANDAGTTTTIVGADPASGEGMRIDDKFKLFNASGLIEETVFRVTTSASATGVTTVTFTPAAAVATVSGDEARLVSLNQYQDAESVDRALKAVSATSYSDARLRQMTHNDKMYALRLESKGANEGQL